MKFNSKRNEVTLKGDVVFKHFCDMKACERELSIARQLSENGVAVPKIVGNSEKTIWYEYIKSATYAELVDCFLHKHAQALVHWLCGYYEVTNTLRGDVNLRNFLYCDSMDICVGVDFEDECLSGEKESDYGRIIAFALTYDPAFCEDKRKCARELLEAFSSVKANMDRVLYYYCLEIEAIIKRRPASAFSKADAQDFIKELIDEFKA